MYSNSLIYGKNDLERVVSVEASGPDLILYRELEDGSVTETTLDATYWTITAKRISQKQRELTGSQHYKYIAEFDSADELQKVQTLLYQKRIDFYRMYDPKEANLVIHGLTYFKGMQPKDVSILSWDIETTGLTHDKNSKVLLISNTFRRAGKITKRLFAYDDYDSQGSMLTAWCDFVRDCNPAIIAGHNVFGFDFLYIKHCSDMAGVPLCLGRDGSEIVFPQKTSKKRASPNDIEFLNAKIFGREIVDTMFLSMTYDFAKKYSSYGLKAIIKEEGLEKADRVFYDAGQIRYKYQDPEEWKKIKAYAIDDADDALALFDLMIPAYFYFTQSVSKSFQMMINSATGSQINNMMVRSYLQDGHSIAKATELTEHIDGGISFAVPMVYKNLLKVDLKSCYPSQILRFKLYDKLKDPLQYFYKIVHHFTYERFDLKKIFKETNNINYYHREQAGKIVINSAYGLTNTNGLNYNSPALAAKITAESRAIIDFALTWASGKGKDYWMALFKERTGQSDGVEVG